MNTGIETTTTGSEEIEITTSSTSTMSTEMNLELSATTGLVGITLGEVSTVSTSTATLSTTSDSSIPDGPSTTTTEPVFTTTTKSSTTTTTLEDNVTTTTTTPPPTVAQDATTTEKESTSESIETTEENETTQGNDVTAGEENTASTTTENVDVSDPVTEPSTDSTSVADNGVNDSDIDDEPEHPTIGWPSKNQNVQVKKIVREFIKILSEFRGKMDDDFIDRWTGQNGGVGKFQNNADRIMRSITSSDRECIDLDTKIPNPFKQELGFKNYTQPTFDP